MTSATGSRGCPVRAAEGVALLQNLVAIPSLSGHESHAVEHLVAWMGQHGMEAEVDAAGNAVGRRGDGPNRIVLLGHIDTFPGDLPVKREGRWLYGRGSVDAKGPLCAFACAAASVDVADDWQVVVVGAVEEEAASSRGARHVLALLEAPQHCIIGEPSSWDRLTVGYKGALRAVLRWRSPLAHSAGPHRSPAEQAVAIWNDIVSRCQGFNRGREGGFNRLDSSLTRLCTQDDGAFSDVSMNLGFRIPPTLTPDEVADEVAVVLRRHLPDLTIRRTLPAQDGQAAPEGAWLCGDESAYRAQKSTDLVRAFLSAIREKGGEPRFVVKTGTSDMNVVGPAWGPSILAYGPGDSALDHTPDERIDLDEYLLATEVLKNVLAQLLMGPARVPGQGDQ